MSVPSSHPNATPAAAVHRLLQFRQQVRQLLDFVIAQPGQQLVEQLHMARRRAQDQLTPGGRQADFELAAVVIIQVREQSGRHLPARAGDR